LSLGDLLEQKGARFVEYAGWQAIDAAERAAGEPLGRPRVKLTAWERLLEAGGKIPR
jgi:ferredoxin--NADP+ reductase